MGYVLHENQHLHWIAKFRSVLFYFYKIPKYGLPNVASFLVKKGVYMKSVECRTLKCDLWSNTVLNSEWLSTLFNVYKLNWLTLPKGRLEQCAND